MFGWFKNKTKNIGEYGKKITNIKEIKQNSNDIFTFARKYLSPKKIIENAKVETFEEAQKRLQVTDSEISQVYKNYAISFYVSFACTCFCFLGFIYYSFFMQQIMPSLSMIAIFLLCAINTFKFSFRAFQIKHKNLCSINDWWERAYDWFPKL